NDKKPPRRPGAKNSLQTWLNRMEFTNLSRPAVTGAVTNEVTSWPSAHRFEVRREVEHEPTKYQPHWRKLGLLDLMCTHASGQQIAVEIDFENKIWSIEKLAAEA